MTTKPTAGAALEKVIRDDLPPHVELDPREETLLAAADLPAGATTTVLRAEKAAKERWKRAS